MTFANLIRQFSQLFTWFVVVAPWEQAVRVRLGKHVHLLDAGVCIKIPFVDRVFRQSIRRRLSIIRAQTLTTLDGKVVTCAGAIGYNIADLRKLYDTLESPNGTIENEVSGCIADFVARHDLTSCTAAGLQDHVMASIKLSNYGLAGQEFYLTHFAVCPRTLRLITGGIDVWANDGGINMESPAQPGAPIG